MNLRFDCLPGEWQDEEPIIEPWPDEAEGYKERPALRKCIVCGNDRYFELEAAGEQDGWITYGCKNVYGCAERFDAILAKTQTPRTTTAGKLTAVQGA